MFFLLGLFFFQAPCTYSKDANNNITAMSAGCVVFVDPANHDFRLAGTAATNPAIGNGLCLPEVTKDIDGNPRPTPQTGLCDIGAYESVIPQVPAPTNLRVVSVRP